MEGLYKFDQEKLVLSNNFNKITVMKFKMTNIVNIACQHLNFLQTKSDSTYPLYILIV